MKKILLAMLFGAMTLTSFAEGKLKVVAAYGGKEKIFQPVSYTHLTLPTKLEV